MIKKIICQIKFGIIIIIRTTLCHSKVLLYYFKNKVTIINSYIKYQLFEYSNMYV